MFVVRTNLFIIRTNCSYTLNSLRTKVYYVQKIRQSKYCGEILFALQTNLAVLRTTLLVSYGSCHGGSKELRVYIAENVKRLRAGVEPTTAGTTRLEATATCHEEGSGFDPTHSPRRSVFTIFTRSLPPLSYCCSARRGR